MHFVLNDKYTFTPWIVSQQTRPTKEMCIYIYKYIENNSQELLSLTSNISDSFMVCQVMVREAIKDYYSNQISCGAQAR
jgi:hypothetical protein